MPLFRSWSWVDEKKRKRYIGQIVYIPQATITIWIMHFAVVCNLELCLEGVKNFYSSKSAEEGPYLEVIFNEEEIALDIPIDGITLPGGWALRPLIYPLKLAHETVDMFRPGQAVPACQIQLVWLNAEKFPEELSYMIHVKGVMQPDTYIRVTRNPVVRDSNQGTLQTSGTSTPRISPPPSSSSGTSFSYSISSPTTSEHKRSEDQTCEHPRNITSKEERPDLTTLKKFPVQSGYINIMQEVVPQYQPLGNILLRSHNGARVHGIEKSKLQSTSDIVYEIFRQWLEEDADATWRKLVQCLEEAGLSALAQKVNSCLK